MSRRVDLVGWGVVEGDNGTGVRVERAAKPLRSEKKLRSEASGEQRWRKSE